MSNSSDVKQELIGGVVSFPALFFACTRHCLVMYPCLSAQRCLSVAGRHLSRRSLTLCRAQKLWEGDSEVATIAANIAA